MLTVLAACLLHHLPLPANAGARFDAWVLATTVEWGIRAEWTGTALPRDLCSPGVVMAVISPAGGMPALPCRVRLAPGFSLQGEILYHAFVEYDEKGRDDGTPTFYGRSAATEMSVNLGAVPQGGRCFVEMDVPWRHATGATGLARLTGECRIAGTNPTPAAIRARLGEIEAQVIAFKESRFRQFTSAGGPVFGPPRGFGIMQLDTPVATAREIWDWRANVDAGLAVLREKAEHARRAPIRVRYEYAAATDFTPHQLKLETYQRYNGGAYWGWDDAAGTWVRRAPNNYADDCLAIERAVESGSPPANWN